MPQKDRIAQIEHMHLLGTEWQRASTRAALCAGVLALSIGFGSFWLTPAISPQHFVLAWLGCAAAVIACIAFLHHNFSTNSRTGGEVGMILRDALPSILTGTIFTTVVLLHGASLSYIAFMWMVFYGLALLSLRSHAPSSLIYLGWAFLLAGLAVSASPPSIFFDGNLLMALTFGLFHLAYALLARGS